jgi:hypothetical protein
MPEQPSPTYLKRLAKLEARITALGAAYTPLPPHTFWLNWGDNPRSRQYYLGALGSYVAWQEREAKPKKPKRVTARYWAIHESGLRNGSFFRVLLKRSGKPEHPTAAQFINGDYMGSNPDEYMSCGDPPTLMDDVPTHYGAGVLVEFTQERAEKLIPACCGGKR